MIFLRLFYEFAKVGLFTFGGGMATLPLLTDLGARTGWFSQSFVTEMIAISESTPGPIGINMATYVGYNIGKTNMGAFGGILGGVIASIGVALPCIIISLIVARCLAKFSKSSIVKNIFYGIRPVVLSLIAVAAWSLICTVFVNQNLFSEGASFFEIISFTKVIYFAIILFAILKFKKHPIIYIAASALIGIIFAF